MKIPGYVMKAILARERAAGLLVKSDSIISEFCEKHDIDCEFTHLQVEIIGNPSIARQGTIDAIENA